MLVRYMLISMLLSMGVRAEDGIEDCGRREAKFTQWIIDVFGKFTPGDAANSAAAQAMMGAIKNWFPSNTTPVAQSVFDGRASVAGECFLQTSFELGFYLHINPVILSTLALVYMNKIKERGFVVAPINWNRLYLASFLVANKFYIDHKPVTETQFATLTGMQPADIKEMVREFLKRIDYELDVSEEEFKSVLTGLSRKEELPDSSQKLIVGGPPSPVRKDKPENPEIN